MRTPPFAVAHRGCGSNLAPENTMEAFRQASSLGLQVVNVDCWQGIDRSIICVHDTTFDRTTTLEGTVESGSQTVMSTGLVDAGSWFASGWSSTLAIPTLDQVLIYCKQNDLCLVIEMKSSVNTRSNCMNDCVAKIVKYGMQKQVILQTAQSENFPCVAAARAGIMLGYIADGPVPTSSTLLNTYGVTFFTFNITNGAYTTNYLSGLSAAGIWLDGWTLSRQSDWATAQGLGAKSGTSDDPLYTFGNQPYMTTDPFLSQTYSHGMIPSGATRGSFLTSGSAGSKVYWFSIGPTVASGYGVLQGWGSRALNQTSIQFSQRYETISSDTGRFGYVAFFCTNDAAFSDGGGFGNGYIAMLRQDGRLQLYVRTGGSATQLATANTTAPTGGQSVQIKVSVSGSTITVKRNDTNDTVSAADTTYRGGYWHLGVNDTSGSGVQCSWSGVTLT